MAYVSSEVRQLMEERLKALVQKVDESDLLYEELGVFGSYARGEYKSTSDVDLCVITDCCDRVLLSDLRTEAELLQADIVFVTRHIFNCSDKLIHRNIRRDYRRVKLYAEK